MLLAQCDDMVDALATDCSDQPVPGEFVNYAAIGIWNRPRQWYRQA